METTIYLATDRGLTVIAGSDGNWRGKVCLEDKHVQCVVADSNKRGFVYCGTFGDGLFTSENGGATWEKSAEIFKWSGSGSMVYVNPQNVPITGVTIFYAALQFADSTHAQAFVVGESEAKSGGTCTVIITSDGSSQTSLLPILGPSSFAAYLFK